ncbi:MAG: peptide-methionine (S)-S-oxide reductase MsrA [Verrucomicrobiae bacterium]|nr:peptide-methionine (S)-S-oxide reductase MsrA [Verrucomicrobiae bacterium]
MRPAWIAVLLSLMMAEAPAASAADPSASRSSSQEKKMNASPSEKKSKEPAAAKTETATLAAGCFWGVEEIFRKIPGVTQTVVGYTGGTIADPTYEQVCTGRTGHAEAIEIHFDPSKTTYAKILDVFFRMHDPTTPNRQHNDVGTQYRSAIFYHSPEQKKIAEEVKERVGKSGRFSKPIVTEILPAKPFYSAEEYHQDYLQKHPGGYNCHVLLPE